MKFNCNSKTTFDIDISIYLNVQSNLSNNLQDKNKENGGSQWCKKRMPKYLKISYLNKKQKKNRIWNKPTVKANKWDGGRWITLYNNLEAGKLNRPRSIDRRARTHIICMGASYVTARSRVNGRRRCSSLQ